eukprot:4083014-Lingulodinium_polyedra.AAC.1
MEADKKVLAIDAQYSTLMNVIYQLPHGAVKDSTGAGREPGAIRCIHTVRGHDTVLLTKVAGTEGLGPQLQSLCEAVGAIANSKVGLAAVEL